MPIPQRPQALHTVNGWWLDLPGLTSPRFETLSGISLSTGLVEQVDAGTNVKMKFQAGILDFGEIALTRVYDGSSDDLAMYTLATAGITGGLKYAGVLTKRHFGNVVFSIGFDGLTFNKYTYPTFDINSEDKFIVEMNAGVDTWIRIPR